MAFRGAMKCVFQNSGRLANKQSLMKRITPSLASFLHTSPLRQDSFNVQDLEDFQERVLQEKAKLTFVDFHATWCGPCKILGPRLEEVVGERGDVNLAKVDVDDNTDLAMEYDISSVPTVVIFKNGEKIDKFIGVIEKDRIEHYVEKYN